MDLDNADASSTETGGDSSDNTQFGTVGKLFEEKEPPKPMDLSDNKTPAKQTPGGSGPSPDVARDGSVVKNTVEDWGQDEDEDAGLFDIQFSFEAFIISFKAYVKYLIGLSGLALVLIAFYNMFAPVMFGVEYIIDTHHILNPLVFENRDSGSYTYIYISDVVLIAAGGVLAWFS